MYSAYSGDEKIYWSVAYSGASAAADITCGSTGNLRDYINQPWDVIVVHQLYWKNTGDEGFADLPNLISMLRNICPNKLVYIGLQVAWSSGNNEKTMYNNICTAARKAARRYDVDFVIPTGTAIENARVIFGGILKNNLLRDNIHAGIGLGRYVAGCSWWEAVIKPWCGMSILGNTLTKNAADDSDYRSDFKDSFNVGNVSDGAYDINHLCDSRLAQWCAVVAKQNKCSVTPYMPTLLEMVLSGDITDEQKSLVDLTGDGSVDGSDVSALLEIMLSYGLPY